jgi:hypothetical protein
VRVEGFGEKGKVKITLAFDDWKAGNVAPATFELPMPPKKEPERK